MGPPSMFGGMRPRRCQVRSGRHCSTRISSATSMTWSASVARMAAGQPRPAGRGRAPKPMADELKAGHHAALCASTAFHASEHAAHLNTRAHLVPPRRTDRRLHPRTRWRTGPPRRRLPHTCTVHVPRSSRRTARGIRCGQRCCAQPILMIMGTGSRCMPSMEGSRRLLRSGRSHAPSSVRSQSTVLAGRVDVRASR